MSKRTIALIIGLFAITAILVLIAIYGSPAKKPQPAPVATVSPKQTVLSISADQLATSSAMSSSSANVNILTGKNKVTVLQLELSFDPKAIGNVDITAGDFFKNAGVLIKDINQEKGLISYVLGISPGQSGVMGQGIVAKISYESRATSSATTTIKFLPKTLVTAEGIATSVLKQAVNGTLKIEPKAMLTPIPTISSGTPSAR